jgi:hypothetical protein
MRSAILATLLVLAAMPLAAQPLSRGERDRALSALHGTRKLFLDLVASASEAQWRFKPAPEVWSLAEVAEHIVLSESSLAAFAQKVLASPADPKAKEKTAGQDRRVLEEVPKRETKAQAPEFLQPRGTYPSREAVRAAFKQARDRNIAFVRETDAPLRQHVADHPALGPLDAYQWYLLIASHSERHVNQMREVLAHPNCPK